MNINNGSVIIEGMYKHRLLTDRFKRLISYFPAVVVTGARQVGKSTFVKHVLGPGADYVLFDPVEDVENARAEPHLFLNNHQTPLILDEIQYVPELVPVIKRRIDANRSPGQYVLTGSQQWSVMKSIAESLAGRAVFLDLNGFSLQEIAQNRTTSWLERWLDTPTLETLQATSLIALDHSLYETLWRGFLPEATLMPLDLVNDFHKAYFRTYIERDARQFADVSDWQQFSRFMRLVAALTAQEINYSQVGRDIGLNPQTAKRWLDILKATFQWFEVSAYSNNAIKRVSSKPKGYLSDTGMACFSQAISTPGAIAAHPLWGALFESAVVNELRKQLGLMKSQVNMYHWRAYSGAEVDLILERDGCYYPIEIKATSAPKRKHTTGISAFRTAYPGLNIASGLVIGPIEKPMPLSEIDMAMPWHAFLPSPEKQ